MALLGWIVACLAAGALGGLLVEKIMAWRDSTPPRPEPPRGDPYLLRGWMEAEQLAPSSRDDP